MVMNGNLSIQSASDPFSQPLFAHQLAARSREYSPRSEITLGGFYLSSKAQDDSYAVVRVVRDERTNRDELVVDTKGGRVKILWDAARHSVNFNPRNEKGCFSYRPLIHREGTPTLAGAERFLTCNQFAQVVKKRLEAKKISLSTF